ncbi:MAG: penicillin-binding protein [Lachnospiraceae bacterium]|nr:penicillin-binding protein [Lachnospiraceae bacterium]
MFRDILEAIAYKLKELTVSRILPLAVVFFSMFILLIVHLYNLQIVGGEEAQETYIQQKTLRTVALGSTRGNIYDRSGNLLAYNELVYSVTLKDTGDYNGYQKNLKIIELLDILDSHQESVTTTLPMYIDSAGRVQYSVSGNSILRLLRDVYGKRSVQEVLDDEKCDENISAEGLYELLFKRYGIGREGSSENAATYDITKADALRVINIRYLLATNSYQRYRSVVVSKGVSEETMTEILEHSDSIAGVDIEEDYQRVYVNGIYFAHIIGYTGAASAEDLERLNAEYPEDAPRYVSSDIVGKTGIEASMEDELQGQKGSRTMYLDSLGRILEVTDEEAPVTGNDIYLTIDSDLQIGIYHLIEQHLAGIISDKLENSKVYNPAGTSASKRRLSIYEVYYQMINNNILDMDAFSLPEAGEAQQRIYSAFLGGQQQAYDSIREELLSDTPKAYKDLGGQVEDGEENFMKTYFSYVYDILLDSGYLISSQVDRTDPVYTASKTDETISLAEFLRYAMSKGWIDVARLELSGAYTSADDTYNALVDCIDGLLKGSKTFSKRIYKYLIYNQFISGSDICLALFEQQVLDYDEAAVRSLSSGSSVNAYDFMVSKINSLEITPAQLAMDPCSAAVTIVDIYTGEVLACVSYPSYDNNKLSVNIDAEYYSTLVNDLSSPLYNTATQSQKAPGSVFKLITSAAALEEGVVTANEILRPEGVFTKQGLNLACSYYTIYHEPHAPLNIVDAIAQSCNYFFCEMGWRLSQVKNSAEEWVYNEPKGLSVLSEYAGRLGLGSKTGIELTEKEPQISDSAPIPSAIGQGNNLFSNVQLARYLTTLANRGTIYDLTLIDKVTDKNGATVFENEPKVAGYSELDESTWNTIQAGMRAVATKNSGTKKNITCEVQIAGKTGTAEENKLRPNHANFISYAPYESPEIGVATSIIFGYTASNSVKLSSDVYDLYYGKLTIEDILSRGASKASNVVIID